MTQIPDISIIIVNWNTRDLLVTCLRSIGQNVGNLEVEIIVVDNASTDGSQAMVRQQFPQVHLMANSENVGFARANNQAIQHSTGRFILLLNSDTEVVGEALPAMLDFMENEPGAGMAGSKLIFANGEVQNSHGLFPTVLSEIVNVLGIFSWRSSSPSARMKPAAAAPVETDWLLGACMMVRRDVIDQVGELDEQFFMYSEEIDWCRRIKNKGWRIYYLPQAHIIHYWRGSSSQQRNPMKAQLYKSKFLYFRKHHGRAAAFILRLTVLLTSLIKMASYYLASILNRERLNQAKMWQTVAASILT